MVDYLVDGSFEGLLTAVFESFERRQSQVKLLSPSETSGLFGKAIEIHPDPSKAERVWKGLRKKTGEGGVKNYYKAFLSEDPAVCQRLFDYALYIFKHGEGHFKNFGNDHVLAISQLAHKVDREKHRMEAFVRFQKSSDGLFFALIHPDYNVLPLIIRHFRDRYRDQPWLIYDKKRKYGIHYDLHQVHEVKLETRPMQDVTASSTITVDEHEALYTSLWKAYFKSTNIPERKNLKLHLQHVPKRYWHYLTEKEDLEKD